MIVRQITAQPMRVAMTMLVNPNDASSLASEAVYAIEMLLLLDIALREMRKPARLAPLKSSLVVPKGCRQVPTSLSHSSSSLEPTMLLIE